MDNPNNEKKELQKEGISEPFLEYPDTNHSNIKHNHFRPIQDDSSRRIQETLNAHKNLNMGHSFLESNEEENKQTGLQESLEQEFSQDLDEEDSYELAGQSEDTTVSDTAFHKTVPQRILEFVGFSKTITSNRILSYVYFFLPIFIFVSLLLFSILLLNNGRGSNGKKEASNYLAYGYMNNEGYRQSLVDYLKSNGWCEDNTECLESTAYRFYKTFRDKIEAKQDEYETQNKENDCKKNLIITNEQTSLFISTIFYGRSDDDLLSSEKVSNWKFLQYMEEMDYLIESVYQKENACYVLSTDYYENAIVESGGYLDRFRSDLGTNLSNDKKSQIYDDILNERDYYEGVTSEIKGIVGGYTECSGVTVVDKQDNIIGTYPLEDYVAGVLSKEMYGDFPMESQKALAIAARTYVLSRTNSCKKSIESSSNRQNFTEDIQEFAREAVNATAGQVLVDSMGNIFTTEYDSWNCKGQNTCTYVKKPAGEIHEVTISNQYLSRANGGHGRGMSQIAAADMAYHGKNYQEILLFFYSDGVKIANLTVKKGPGLNSVNSKGFIQRTVQPTIVGRGNQFYFTDLNKSYSNGYLGQCTWYAYGRANEILSNAGSNLKWTIASDAGTWYQKNLERGSNGFESSSDYTEPRAGAIIVWRNASHGHVAVVESVNADGTVTISEANIGGVRNSITNPYGWQYVTLSLENIRLRWKTYIFAGYIYMLK